MWNNNQLTMTIWLRVRHVWMHGFLIGLTLGAICIGGYYIFTTLPFFSPAEQSSDKPPAQPLIKETLTAKPAPQLQLTPQANLEVKLAQIINGIKETTLKKDLPGLLKLYSSSFPNLTDKKQKITRSWKTYDYQKMDFKIHQVKSSSEDSAVVWITWDTTVREKATGKVLDFSKRYQVTFVKESESWHIKGLNDAVW